MNSHDDILVQFMAMIGDDVLPETAVEILEMHDWSLEAALSSIFDDPSRMQRTTGSSDLHSGLSNPYASQRPSGDSVIDLDIPEDADEDTRWAVSESLESGSFATQRSLQDEEYQESLRIDQARQSAAREAAERRNWIPSEPAAGEPDRLQLMIRFPDGKRLSRAFRSTEEVQVVADFVEAAGGLASGTFRLASAHPRRVFAALTLSLADSGVENQSTLVVEKIYPSVSFQFFSSA